MATNSRESDIFSAATLDVPNSLQLSKDLLLTDINPFHDQDDLEQDHDFRFSTPAPLGKKSISIGSAQESESTLAMSQNNAGNESIGYQTIFSFIPKPISPILIFFDYYYYYSPYLY